MQLSGKEGHVKNAQSIAHSLRARRCGQRPRLRRIRSHGFFECAGGRLKYSELGNIPEEAGKAIGSVEIATRYDRIPASYLAGLYLAFAAVGAECQISLQPLRCPIYAAPAIAAHASPANTRRFVVDSHAGCGCPARGPFQNRPVITACTELVDDLATALRSLWDVRQEWTDISQFDIIGDVARERPGREVLPSDSRQTMARRSTCGSRMKSIP